MTNQELFDTVAAHLLRQGRRAITADGYNCRYRTEPDEDGVVLKCAIGCLIPDELYRPGFEGCPLNVGNISEAAGLQQHQISLGLLLQTLHDGGASPTTWREQLTRIAAAYQLSAAVLDTCEDNTGGNR